MKKANSLLILLTLSVTGFTSCVDLASLQAQAQDQLSQQNFEAGGFDNTYASAIENNFNQHSLSQEEDCWRMQQQGQSGQQGHRLPPQRPTQYGQYQAYNQYGMGVDGSRIQRSGNSFNFETHPSYLADYRSNKPMIGVSNDGTPIYAQYMDQYDETPRLDANGGQYAATEDFPNGVYHYVVVIKLNY